MTMQTKIDKSNALITELRNGELLIKLWNGEEILICEWNNRLTYLKRSQDGVFTLETYLNLHICPLLVRVEEISGHEAYIHINNL